VLVSLLSIGAVVLVLLPVTALADEAQPAPATARATETAPEPEDPGAPMGPHDPFNRGTPRGTAYGFAVACRESDYERAAEYLDLRRLPESERKDAAEIARKLRAAIGPVLDVDFSSLSASNDGTPDDGLPPWQDRLGTIETRDGLVPILLQRVPREGDGVRIWKIASSTVARTDALYAEFGPTWLERWLPPVLFEVRLLRLQLAQILGIVGVAFLGWLASLLLAGTATRILGRLFTSGESRLDERIVLVVRGPVRLALTVLLFDVGLRTLALDLWVHQLLRMLEWLVLIIAAAWLLCRIVDIVVLGFRTRAQERGNIGLLPALPPLQRITTIAILGLAFVTALAVMGVNVTAAVAGLGVGGIALALAAQKTLENLFGGFTLFADQPVRVGDFCRFDDQVGTVEEIGLRSTRVRTLDRTLVSVPNAEFSNLRLENYTKRDRILLNTVLGVRYETTADQLRFLLARIREILIAHPRVTVDPARIRFVGFGAYSLDLEVFAYVDTNDWNEFLAIREDIFLRFIDAVNEAGSSFAFPSSTMYVGRDDGLDAAAVRRAEERVAAWRDQGELPFPDVPEELRREVWNSLDWPPKGSPNAAKDAPER
jgi:MscS family membrane protein